MSDQKNHSGSRPTSIKVSARRTVNLGDFNSVSFEASVDIDVNDDPVKRVYDQAWSMVTNEVNKRVMETTGEV